MKAISEFREFFTRITKVNSGSVPDKEANYPNTHVTKLLENDSNGNPRLIDKEVYNRFVENGIPSLNIWKKLIASIAFLNNDLSEIPILTRTFTATNGNKLTGRLYKMGRYIFIEFQMDIVNQTISTPLYTTMFNIGNNIVKGEIGVMPLSGVNLHLKILPNGDVRLYNTGNLGAINFELRSPFFKLN